jgi:hypothetical protein
MTEIDLTLRQKKFVHNIVLKSFVECDASALPYFTPLFDMGLITIIEKKKRLIKIIFTDKGNTYFNK